MQEGRYRIRNIKSNLYLGVQLNLVNDNGGSLAIENYNGQDLSQIWYIIQFRPGGSYILLNQHSGYVACIRSRSTDNEATAIQYYSQLLESDGNFQQWNFVPRENNYLIQDAKSQKYIGPQNRSTTPDHWVVQWSDQTAEDNYQLWVFEAAELA